MLLLVKQQVSLCNFTKSNTLSWVFFMFFRLHKWYQIFQRISLINVRPLKTVFQELSILMQIHCTLQLSHYVKKGLVYQVQTYQEKEIAMFFSSFSTEDQPFYLSNLKLKQVPLVGRGICLVKFYLSLVSSISRCGLTDFQQEPEFRIGQYFQISTIFKEMSCVFLCSKVYFTASLSARKILF